MADRGRQLREDRLLRDAARTLVRADLDRVKSDLEEKTIGKRAADRAMDGAAELLDAAKARAGNNIGVVALLVGAVALWLARNPVLSLFGGNGASDEDHPEPTVGETP